MKSLEIQQSLGSPKIKVHEKNFTGRVLISNYVERSMPSNIVSATVSFSPGARTPWKFNSLGQTLIILSGKGWAQCKGEDIVEIKEGDIVWCPPGLWHWDGASQENSMTYIAVYEGNDGEIVQFGEKVTEDEFSKALRIYETFQNDKRVS